MAYLIKPVTVNGQKYCFTDGDTTHLSREWRTPAEYPTISGSTNTATETTTDTFEIVPSFNGPATNMGAVEFAIACGVTAFDLTVTHDRDSKDDEAWIKVFLDGTNVAESISILGTTGDPGDEHDWLLAGGSSFVLTVSGLGSTPCGAIVRIEALMENSGTGGTYIEAAITSVS